MIDKNDIRTIRWVNGLPLHPAHFQWLERFIKNELAYLLSYSGQYGLLGEPFDNCLEVKLEYFQLSPTKIKLLLTHCMAIAPNGSIININGITDDAKHQCPSCLIDVTDSNLKFNIYVFEDRAWPPVYDGRMISEIALSEESDKRLQVIEPDYRLVAVSKNDAGYENTSFLNSAFKVAEGEIEKGKFDINRSYVPASLRMNCHKVLRELAIRIGRNLHDIYRISKELLRKSQMDRFQSNKQLSLDDFQIPALADSICKYLMESIDYYDCMYPYMHPREWMSLNKSVIRMMFDIIVLSYPNEEHKDGFKKYLKKNYSKDVPAILDRFVGYAEKSLEAMYDHNNCLLSLGDMENALIEMKNFLDNIAKDYSGQIEGEEPSQQRGPGTKKYIRK